MSTPTPPDPDGPAPRSATRRAGLRTVPTGGAAPARGPARGPVPPAADVPSAGAVQFSDSVRRVVDLAVRGGLSAPVFRSPPRIEGVDRTIRRGRNSAVVAVRRQGRPLAAVQADVIEGVVAANGLEGVRADRFRRAAWNRLEQSSRHDAAGPSPSEPPRRVA